jgi:Mce-associated membrane protein
VAQASELPAHEDTSPVEEAAPADGGPCAEEDADSIEEASPEGLVDGDPSTVEDADPVKETATGARTLDPLRAVAVALVVVAAVAAGYFGWSWYAAAHDGSLRFSKERDAVLRAGEQGVQNLNTLDYRKVDEGFSLWEDSSTGDLHQQLLQGRDQFEAQVRQARTVTTAKILDGAIVELDARAGKARMIVAVQITVAPASGAPATKQSRMQAQLARTPSGWKLNALGQAPVGASG